MAPLCNQRSGAEVYRSVVDLAKYRSLYSRSRDQNQSEVFAFFPPDRDRLAESSDYNAPWLKLAEATIEGSQSWEFSSEKYKKKYPHPCPKLRNYLQYTFVRLKELERESSGHFFIESADRKWACFNTGLQDRHSADLFSVFERYEERRLERSAITRPDWIYRGTLTAREHGFRQHFGAQRPEIAWYSMDSRDFVFNLSYTVDTDLFSHMFDRAQQRCGFPPDATEELVNNYIRGAIENLVPKIKRNYKTAIPMYYVEERRMQLLLPFVAYNGRDTACLLMERDDTHQCYTVKTVLEMDQAFFAARLLTRPDKEWLNP